jgi:lycopene beta-cyclase
MEKPIFDIAVLGAGCSGFQLLFQLSMQPDWQTKKIALLGDGVPLQRSWCFWSDTEHPLQHLVTKSWHKITFKGKDFSKTEDVSPYKYHYIPGEGFFEYFQKNFLNKHQNIAVFNEEVAHIEKKAALYHMKSATQQWQSAHVFSSISPKVQSQNTRFWLKQHFKGWFIRAEEPIFDESNMTIMDFSIHQANDTRFVYVLPFSPYEALVEMTVFSPQIYPDLTYDNVLSDYMRTHYAGVKFSVLQSEFGQIPMTDALFPRLGIQGEVLLGTAAGMVKASTGYAFKRISKDSQQLAEDLGKAKPWRSAATEGRFKFYDRLLLGIITDEPLNGSRVFEALFKKVKMTTIFRFLDEETKLWEEILLFSKLPYFPFLKQVYRQWMR